MSIVSVPDQSLGELADRLLTVKSNAGGIIDRLRNLIALLQQAIKG